MRLKISTSGKHIINVIFPSKNINGEIENRRNVFNMSNYQSEFVNTKLEFTILIIFQVS